MAVCERCGKEAGVVTVGRMSLCAGCGASVPPPPMAPPGQGPPPQGPPPPGPPPQEVSWGEPPPAQTPGPAEWAAQPGPPPAWGPAYGPPPKKQRSAVAIVFIVLGVLVFGVVGVAVVLAFVQSEDDKDAAEAVDDFSEGTTETFAYTAPDGSFTIEFPEEPRSEDSVQPLEGESVSVNLHAATARVGRLNVFEAGYNDYPPELQLDAAATLQGYVDVAVDTYDAALLDDTETTYGFLPARDFTIRYDDEGADQEMIAKYRVIVSGQRVYLVVLSSEAENIDAFDAFVDSFEIVTQ